MARNCAGRSSATSIATGANIDPVRSTIETWRKNGARVRTPPPVFPPLLPVSPFANCAPGPNDDVSLLRTPNNEHLHSRPVFRRVSCSSTTAPRSPSRELRPLSALSSLRVAKFPARRFWNSPLKSRTARSDRSDRRPSLFGRSPETRELKYREIGWNSWENY